MQGGRFSARVRAPPASASAPRRALVHARDLPAVRRAHESPSSFWIEAFPATLSDFPFKGSSGATDDLCTPRGGAVSLALASVSQLGRPGSPPPRPPMLNDRSEGLDETFPGRRSFDASSGSHPRFRPAQPRRSSARGGAVGGEQRLAVLARALAEGLAFLQPTRAESSSTGYAYTQVEAVAGLAPGEGRVVLDGLAERGFLAREVFGFALLCPSCGARTSEHVYLAPGERSPCSSCTHASRSKRASSCASTPTRRPSSRASRSRPARSRSRPSSRSTTPSPPRVPRRARAAARRAAAASATARASAAGAEPHAPRSASAICTAFVAAPLRTLSTTHHSHRRRGCVGSRRTRPTKTSSEPATSSGVA